MNRKLYILLIAILAVQFSGCPHTTEPGIQESCSLNSGPFLFYTGDRWLRVGNEGSESSTLLDLIDPTNPVPLSRSDYMGDTSFILGIQEFALNSYGVFFTDTIGTGKNIWAAQDLTAGTHHLALYNGTAYLLRRIITSSNERFCQRMGDSVNELDVDGFSDSGYFEPKLYTTVKLSDPQDILAYNGVLFVLDGLSGLKIFDLHDPKHPAFVTDLSAIQGYHLQVSLQSTLLVYTTGGIIQLDISNPINPLQLSKIS